MMSKLYVGNLPSDVTESTLRDLFTEHGVTTSSVLVKRGGYAFIDCSDPTEIDHAVSSLNGKLHKFVLCYTLESLESSVVGVSS